MDFHDSISAATHLFMAGWCLLTLLVLTRLTTRHSVSQRRSVRFYGLSAVVLYLASGLFHGLHHSSSSMQRIWQLIDQSAIFALIFGSNLPLYVYLLENPWRHRLCFLMGTIGFMGILCLWLSHAWQAPVPHLVLVLLYLAMGVLGLMPLRIYVRKLGSRSLIWIGMLSGFYIGGAVCEATRWPVLIPGYFGYHEILHITDILGTLSHLVLLLGFILPQGGHQKSKFPVTVMTTSKFI